MGNNLTDAIAIFKLIIAEFPNSTNAFDSMGEAYLQAKDSSRALQNYEQSLRMNPDNFHAEDVIEQIKSPNSKPLPARRSFLSCMLKEYWEDLDSG